MTEQIDQLVIYDHPELQKTFVSVHDNGNKSVVLNIEGIHCGACVHRCERSLADITGIIEWQVNLATHRAQLVWQSDKIKLSTILTILRDKGYPAYPYNRQDQQNRQQYTRKQALRRLALAGFAMMQVMMFSVALYAGDFQDMDSATRDFLRWMSLLVTLPVLCYSAQPFFANALQGIQRQQLGMDLPVSIAISIAFFASFWATLSQQGDVYFDSVTMFVFLLLLGRFLELSARLKASRASDDLIDLLPSTAVRIDDNTHVIVPVFELKKYDQVLLKPGESVPVDGKVISGTSTVDESLLTGESKAQLKQQNDLLIGGSVNIESPLIMQVEKVGDKTYLAAMKRLLQRAQSEKPRLAQLADQIASVFVAVLLLLASAVFLYWWHINPDNALWVTLSVLVVTCPCALSLATPTALTAANTALTRMGLLATRAHAMETLARANHIVFDKTGTLTYGRLILQKTQALRDLPVEQCLAIAATLEQYSEHPVAKALRNNATTRVLATRVKAKPGYGVQASIADQCYRIGSIAFVSELSHTKQYSSAYDSNMCVVALGDEQGLLALFEFSDQLRAQAKSTIAALQTLGFDVELLSGDNTAAVKQVADQVGIEHYAAHLTPQNKLTRLNALQEQDKIVVMVGDGVNDSPVLAQAQVSIAMGGGSEIARCNADMVLVSDRLDDLVQSVVIARRTLAVIRQNLAWALIYNMLALPLAAMGFVAPWLVAIGMSFSSLLVVLNALRLNRQPSVRCIRSEQQARLLTTTVAKAH